MTEILAVAYCVLFLMMVFMIGLYCILNRQVEDMKKTIHYLLDENIEIKRKQRIFDKRFMTLSQPERIVIEHEYSSKDKELKFGGKGI